MRLNRFFFPTDRPRRLFHSWIDRQWQQRGQVISNRWQQQGRTIHFAPTRAAHLGSELHELVIDHRPQGGMIGVADRQVCFVQRSSLTEQMIDLDSLLGVGLSRMQFGSWGRQVVNQVLILHYEKNKRWQMAAFFIYDPDARTALIRTLADLTHREPRDQWVGWDNFGPFLAQRMAQDIYGQWQPAYSSGTAADSRQWGLRGQLQAVLGLLIYNGVIVLDLANVRRVDIYAHERLSPLPWAANKLLRVEYDDEGQHQVAGFMVDSGDRWFNWLRKNLAVPVEIHEGRKKKEG